MITHPGVKLNLGLRVLGKRPDGYHDLDTLFYPCDAFSDTLEIITGDDYSRTSASLFERYQPGEIVQGLADDGSVMITIARRGGVDWDPLKDLTVKAVRLLAERYKLPALKIFLEKTSPVGAGLGGGSADGAFALRMVNELCSLGLSDASLSTLAAQLGSDCPFFIYNRPMLGSGRGEILTPYDLDLSGYEVRVIVPAGIAVSTAEAYRGLRRSADSGDKPRADAVEARKVADGLHGAAGDGSVADGLHGAAGDGLVAGVLNGSAEDGLVAGGRVAVAEVLSRPVSEWKGLLVNDFEASVFPLHPALAEIKASLYAEGALYASMSGSGSALFGIFPLPSVG